MVRWFRGVVLTACPSLVLGAAEEVHDQAPGRLRVVEPRQVATSGKLLEPAVLRERGDAFAGLEVAERVMLTP